MRRASRRIAWLACAVVLLPGLAQGHAVRHEVLDGGAVVVRFSYPGADRPVFEPYEVFAPDSDTPFQAGRVNQLGEVSFRPDRAGTWRVRLMTADGHGAVVALELDAAGAVAATQGGHGHAHTHDHWLRVGAALGYLLGVFGLLALWRARRVRAPAG